MMKRIFCSLLSLALIVTVSGDLMASGRRLSTGGPGAGAGSGVGVRGGDVSTSAAQSRWDSVKDFFSFGKKSASQSLGTKFDDADGADVSRQTADAIRDAVRETMESKVQSEQTAEAASVSDRQAGTLNAVRQRAGHLRNGEGFGYINGIQQGSGPVQLAPAPQAHVPTPNRFKRAGIAMKRGFSAAGAGIATAGKATGRAFVAAGKATGSGIAVAGRATGRGFVRAGRAVKNLPENIRTRIARIRAARRSSTVVHRVPSDDATADLLNAYRQLNVPNRSLENNSLLNEIAGMLSFRLGQGENIEIPPIVPIAREQQVSGSDSTLPRKQEELDAHLNRLQVEEVKEVPSGGF